MGRKRRLRFHISLEDLETPMLSLKELATEHGEGDKDDAPAESPSKPFDEWQERRYNILSQMEAKYTVHSKIKDSDTKPKRRRRQLEDDEYDLDDWFIDDSELVEIFDQQEETEATATKYTGFFVNHGPIEVSQINGKGPAEGGKRRGRPPKVRTGAEAEGGGGGGKRSAAPMTNDDETWLLSDQVKVAYSLFQRATNAWKSHASAEDLTTMKDVPDELHKDLLDFDVVVRGGGQIVSFTNGYIKLLRPCLPLSKPHWKRWLKSLGGERCKLLKERVDRGVTALRALYTQRREALLSNSRLPSSQPTVSPSPSPVPGGLSKEVPLDGALRQKLYEILEDVKTYWRWRSVHMQSIGKTACSYEDEETEVLKAIAAIWPNQAMDVPRLKQVYLEHLAALGQTEELLVNFPPAGMGVGNGGGSGRESAAPSVAGEDVKPPAEKKERKKRVKSDGAEGISGKKPRQRKNADGTKEEPEAEGGAGGAVVVKKKPGRKPGPKPKLSAGGKPKAAAKPKGPVMGSFGLLKRRYDPTDFEVAVNGMEG